MGSTVVFHVMSAKRLGKGGHHPIITLRHHGGFTEVVDQYFGEGAERTIKSRKLPEGSWIFDDDPESESPEKRTAPSGRFLRYTTANQVAKTKMSFAGPFDKAMMAYFKELAKRAPGTIIILERW